MRVVWTKTARSQLAEILAYLAERNAGTRELVLTGLPYALACRVSDRIEILAMMHGTQGWPERF